MVLRAFAVLLHMNAHILRVLASILANNGQRETAYDLAYDAADVADILEEAARDA
jgi:hypothetical protein